MKMSRLSLAMLLMLLLMLPFGAMAAEASYEATLPQDYETSGLNYPVIYVMPQDGYACDASGLSEQLTAAAEKGLGAPMIIVRPTIAEGADPMAAIADVVAAVDAQYRTIPDKAHRAAVGTGVGGYLAYAAALAQDSAFGAVASIRGNFVGEDNPHLAACGSVMDRIESMYAADQTVFDTIYTYMDAPVDDAWTNMEGSTNDMGALFIGYGTGSAFHEFTVRPGAYDEAFLAESAGRVMARLTANMYAGLAVGTVAPQKTTLTAADENAVLDYAVTVTDAIAAFIAGETAMDVKAELYDTAGNLLAEASETVAVAGPGEFAGTLTLKNAMTTNSSSVKLTATLMGAKVNLGAATLILATDPVVDGEFQQIELMGDWYFNYVGAQTVIDVAALTKEEYSAWSVVQPGITSWTKGFGNISDENVVSGYGPDYFNYFIVGSGYYAKTFTVPENFDAKDLVLAAGYVDDRCEVYLNGVRVGATGMDENGQPTGETTWAVFSYFDVDPAIVNVGGENTMVVRAWNDLPFGAGGWYGGPIGLYSKAAFEAQYAEGANPRFYEETFSSACVAKATGAKNPVDNKYLIYLPEGYETSGRNYPTVYLLHQFNSDHTSYRTDKIDKLMDAGIAASLFDEMIVVIPNSSEESWWSGEWEKMITDELIPLIDAKYRTVQDARYRLTAGCSMGGQGAMAVALRNPDFFSGAVSFFGAFSYGGASSPNAIAAAESREYMDSFALYFICGNQDSYGFGVPAIELNQQLEAMDVDHGFFIDNGGHDSTFYVPFFNDAFSYVRANMYKSDDAVEALLSGSLKAEGEIITAGMTADAGIADYLYAIPASSFTKNENPALVVELVIEVKQDGAVVAETTACASITADARTGAAQLDLTGKLDTAKAAAVTLKALVFDRAVTLAEIEIPAK